MADDIPSRVAVLEQIARSTVTTLSELHADIRGLRSEMHSEIGTLRADQRDIRSEARSQFRWLLGITIAVLMAQAALWFRLGTLTAEVSQIAALLRQHVGG